MASDPHRPKKKKITNEFPQDILLFHILPRLPGRSVLRFKCVSKQWHSHLSTPLFKKTHLLSIPNDEHQSPHKLLILSDTKTCKFRTIDCEAPEDSLTPSRNLPFQVNFKRIDVLTTFHGLVCIGIIMFYLEYSSLILWNPLTSEHKKLPKTNWGNGRFNTYGTTFRLYHNSSDDDYKLICVKWSLCCDLYIYSLKSDSWIKIDPGINFYRGGSSECWRPSSWLNGNFYFLREVRVRRFQPRLYYSIIRLNTKTKKFTEMLTPMFRGVETTLSCFTVLRGCIHIYVTVDDYWKRQQMEWEPKVEVWKMDEDEKWTKVVTYVMKKPCLLSQPKPVHVMRNGNWLMHYSNTETDCYFYKVDLEKHIEDNLRSSIDGRFDIHTGKYIETFVSPNQHIK